MCLLYQITPTPTSSPQTNPNAKQLTHGDITMNPYMTEPYLSYAASQHQKQSRDFLIADNNAKKERKNRPSKTMEQFHIVISHLKQIQLFGRQEPKVVTPDKYACQTPEVCGERIPSRLNMSPSLGKLTQDTLNALKNGSLGFYFLTDGPACHNCQNVTPA